MTDVDFHFDVMCPWAYQTSKWIREAAKERDINVTWRFFSLEEVNREEGKKHPWERSWSYGWSMLRVAARLQREPDGNHLVGRFYEVAGRLLHEDGIKVHTPEGVASVLEEIGTDPALVEEAVADESTNETVRADHQRVLDLGGYGVPTMVLGNTVLFGPVITPAPTGAAAGRLWDATVAWAEFPHLYEIRRPKVAADWAHIEASFSPYLNARDWHTIQHPVA
ncbi:MAG TPA: DsbA family protein [Acidimicrobiales bacterium]|jgi:2-hydroxychromene-2-carboxylate isomerase|nr:DsbA family protein [Acidimicrobiales bacterium]